MQPYKLALCFGMALAALLPVRSHAADRITVTDIVGRQVEVKAPVEKVILGEGRQMYFVAALDTLFGSFRQRAEKTFALLQAEGTAFIVVAAPEPDALREAA